MNNKKSSSVGLGVVHLWAIATRLLKRHFAKAIPV